MDRTGAISERKRPTPRTKMPRLDSRLAVQMRRNTAWRKGEKTPRADGARLFAVMRRPIFRHRLT